MRFGTSTWGVLLFLAWALTAQAVECDSGQYYNEDAKKCQRCLSGYYCPGGSSGLIACPEHHSYSDESCASVDCCRCPPGTYVEDMQAQICLTCSENHYCPDGRVMKACQIGNHAEPGQEICSLAIDSNYVGIIVVIIILCLLVAVLVPIHLHSVHKAAKLAKLASTEETVVAVM